MNLQEILVTLILFKLMQKKSKRQVLSCFFTYFFRLPSFRNLKPYHEISNSGHMLFIRTVNFMFPKLYEKSHSIIPLWQSFQLNLDLILLQIDKNLHYDVINTNYFLDVINTNYFLDVINTNYFLKLPSK